MTKTAVATVLAAMLLAGCGGGSEPNRNTNPHQGWVSLGGYDKWRCLGSDKIVYIYDWGDDSGSVASIEDSEDCK